jgi:hypothetical protein
MAQENRPAATNCETAERSAGGLKLADDSTSDASPETAAQLSRIETILDHIAGNLGHALGGVR